MKKYKVEIEETEIRTVKVEVFADTEDSAAERAEYIVSLLEKEIPWKVKKHKTTFSKEIEGEKNEELI